MRVGNGKGNIVGLIIKKYEKQSHKKIGLLVSFVAVMSAQAQVTLHDKALQKIDLGFGVEQSEFLSTVAATTISGEELQQTSAISLADALYGKLLGLNVFQNGGFVGDEDRGATLNIRGYLVGKRDPHSGRWI